MTKTSDDNDLPAMTTNTALSVLNFTEEQDTTVPFLSIVAVTFSDRVAIPSW